MSVSFSQTWAYNEALKEFKTEEKAVLAVQALNIGANYRPPVGWNLGDSEEKYRKGCSKYVAANFNPEPKGFFLTPLIGAWLWNALVSAIVNWVVNKIVERLLKSQT